MTPRSACVLARIRGRWTFTATIVPSWRVAWWTWAVEAAANGTGSNVAYSSSGGEPNSLVTMATTSSYPNGAASLCSFDNSETQTAGRMSLRDAIIWPIFT